MGRMLRKILLQPLRWLFRALFFLVSNLYCIPTYVIWMMVVHPLYYINPQLYWDIEGEFFQWLLTCVGFLSYSAGYYIVESGEYIKNIINEETLVLVNHQSTSDVPLLMHSFSVKNNLLQRLNWIMDARFQYTNFGIVSTFHGDFFIKPGRERRDESLKDLESYLRRTFLPRSRKWLVLFPEGGLLRKRKEASKRYAGRMGIQNLEYVTLPRLGAIQTVSNTLAPNAEEGTNRQSAGRFKYVIDMTIAYPDGEPLDLGDIVLGKRSSCKIQMHYNIYRIDEVPYQNEEELQKWLYEIYIKKNTMLENYYETGIFPSGLNDYKALQVLKGRAHAGENVDVLDKAPQLFPDDDDSLTRSANSLPKKQKEPKSHDTSEPLSEDEVREYGSNYLRMDLFRVGLIHVMFISSTLVHMAVLSYCYRTIGGN